MAFTAQMPTKLLAEILGRMALSLAAGIGVRRAWKGEVERVPRRWRGAMETVGQALGAGESLSEAMALAGETFPPLIRGMVSVGDRTGHEAETLRELARMLDQVERTRRAFVRGLVWPGFQLAIAILVIGFLIWVAGGIRDEQNKPIDILGFGLVGSAGLAAYLSIVAFLAIAGVVAGRMAVASWRRNGIVRRVVSPLPVIGAAARAAEAAAWCRAASLASAAGLDAGTLVRLGATVAPGIPLDADRVERRLREGATLADTLRESGGFPPTLIEGVITGELTGNTAEVLDRLAGDYDEEARQKFEASAQVAGFVVWGLVAALIALVIFRIFSFYVGAIQALAR
ncbi:MAG: type II secretion system F family protein [Planctomycetia bacterium]